METMMKSYAPLKSVEKALLVLEAMNRSASCRIVDLRDATGLAPPTLVRIMETLVNLDYARQMSRLGGYCLTEKVHGLSAGFHGLPKMFDGVRAMADALTAEILWPASLATFDADAMVVRYSTIPGSPLAHKQSTVNHRLDMLSRAHGRAYLAFCPEPEREHIYDVLVRGERHTGTPRALSAEMEPLLERIRRQGIARRDPSLEPGTSTLAVPLWDGGKLVATFGVTFFSTSVRDRSGIAIKLKGISEDSAGRPRAPEGRDAPPTAAAARQG